ncbi:MAG: SGNH/GDSL hydrolase family protein [Planctomycetota bacterium]|jgi:lysophospholipase L1-like esterase
MGKARRILYRLLAVFLSLVAAAVLLEIAFRVAGISPVQVNPLRAFFEGDPVLGHRGRPRADARWKRPEFDVRVVHDARGFRRQEHQVPREDAERSVFVLGDSFTWGWGVDQGEVFTDRLSVLDPTLHVDNLGIMAVGTATQVFVFEREVADRLAPGDVVVVMFFTNDFADCVDERQGHGILEDGVVRLRSAARPRGLSGVEPFLRERSYFFGWLMYQLEARRQQRRADADRGVVPERGDGAASAFERAVVRHALERLHLACREAEAHLRVVAVPEPSAVTAAASSGGAGSAIEAICDALGIPCLDPVAAFREAQAATPLYLVPDGHWTAAGHETMARLLAEDLRDVPR